MNPFWRIGNRFYIVPVKGRSIRACPFREDPDMRHTAVPRNPLSAFVLLLTAAGCGGVTEQAGTEAADSATDASATIELIGTGWEWVATVTPVERIEAADPTRYTLTLGEDGQASAQFDCNGGRGSYTLDGNRISFGAFATTRMGCPEDSQDSVFARQLGEITSYFIDDGQLFLEMPFDSGTMRFRPARRTE
jgi:heat shock protein HslJ